MVLIRLKLPNKNSCQILELQKIQGDVQKNYAQVRKLEVVRVVGRGIRSIRCQKWSSVPNDIS